MVLAAILRWPVTDHIQPYFRPILGHISTFLGVDLCWSELDFLSLSCKFSKGLLMLLSKLWLQETEFPAPFHFNLAPSLPQCYLSCDRLFKPLFQPLLRQESPWKPRFTKRCTLASRPRGGYKFSLTCQTWTDILEWGLRTSRQNAGGWIFQSRRFSFRTKVQSPNETVIFKPSL